MKIIPLSELNGELLRINFITATKYRPKILHNVVRERRISSFLLVLKGEYIYRWVDSEVYHELHVCPGNMLYLPANSSYEYTISSEDTEVIQIEFELWEETKVAFSTHPLCKNCTAEHAFFDIISSSAFGNKLKAIADIYLILSSMNDESSPVASSKIQPAVNYIANNFTNDISVALLAKLCFISESQLRRLFNRDMGVSPTMYKNRLLTLLAQKLLKSNDYPISEISLMLGFSNIYSFSHFFKRETGQSPTEYKKSNGI